MSDSFFSGVWGFGGLGVEGLGPKRVEGYDTVVVVTRRIGLTVMH